MATVETGTTGEQKEQGQNGEVEAQVEAKLGIEAPQSSFTLVQIQ
jgi:hypothetical protein